jgi:DNA-binding beta-propeller fold protein YncE
VSGSYKGPNEQTEPSLAVDPATNTRFLSDYAQKTISISNASSNSLICKIKSEDAPSRIAFDTKHGVLYILDTESHSLEGVSKNNDIK